MSWYDDLNWGQGLQGAGGGAMAGSAAGPYGAIGGAVLGGTLGLFGGGGQGDYRKQLDSLAAGYGRMPVPQAGPAAQAGYSGFRQNQAGLVSMLQSMAQGHGPSAAAIQMREAMDRAAGSQAAAAAGAGGRGVNAGAAYRNSADNMAAIQAQGARDTATLRAQEQLNAVGQLGQTIGQGRAADEGVNTFNAGQTNQAALANLQAKLQSMGLSTEAQLKALMMAMGVAGPGTGTQVLAGGAQALPSILQYKQGQQQLGMQQQYMNSLNPSGAMTSSGPVTQPGQTGMFGAYTRPQDY